MGWKNVGREEKRRRTCKCGRGKVIEYEVEQESDFPPFERSRTESERNCSTPVEQCEYGHFF